MKKLLLIMVLSIGGGITAKAQIIYTPPPSRQSQPTNQTQTESQSIRTTAYYADSYSGRVYKVPIKIQQRANAYGNVGYYVTEYYIDSGIGGRWQKLANPSQISKCNSMLSSNSLEKRYMYKALFNTQTHYFDF